MTNAPLPLTPVPRPRDGKRFWFWMLAVGGLYFGLARIFVELAAPPGLASPLYPAAGIGMGAALISPWGALAAGLASMLSNLSAYGGTNPKMAFILGPWIGFGVAMQCLLGRRLLRSLNLWPSDLSSAREVCLFLLVSGPIACLLSASWATPMLWAVGFIQASDLARIWFSWWAGDSLGVVLAAPFALALWADRTPKSLWRSRRMLLGASSAALCAIAALALLQIAAWEATLRSKDLSRRVAGLAAHLDGLSSQRDRFARSLGKGMQGLSDEQAKQLALSMGEAINFARSVGLERPGAPGAPGEPIWVLLPKGAKGAGGVVEFISADPNTARAIEQGEGKERAWAPAGAGRRLWLDMSYKDWIAQGRSHLSADYTLCLNAEDPSKSKKLARCGLGREYLGSSVQLSDGRWLSLAAKSDGAEEWGSLVLTLLAISSAVGVGGLMLFSTGKAMALERALGGLQAARQEIERQERLAALGRLVSGISHEMGGPLGNALLLSGSAKDQAKSLLTLLDGGTMGRAALRQGLSFIEQQGELCESALTRANELMGAFKRSAVAGHSDRRESFELGPFLRQFELSWSPSLRAKGVELGASGPATLRVESYPGSIGQILGNLATNALLHGYAGAGPGAIEVRAREHQGGVLFTVRDFGRGFSPQEWERAFEPFFTTLASKGGSGLGLAISWDLARKIGGWLRAQPIPQGERGALLELWIPLVAPEREANP